MTVLHTSPVFPDHRYVADQAAGVEWKEADVFGLIDNGQGDNRWGR
jgi:hypothetical protein